MLPAHGKIECRACFGAEIGAVTKPHPDWRMVNDPGAWGRQEPEYLVLGFSKGATQAGIYASGRFEDVPFAGMRDRLTKALRAMEVLGAHETVDQKISDPKSNIAFGSLIRCSVSRRDKKKPDFYSCTGPLIAKSFDEIPQVISACAARHLTGLPASVKAVLLLGNSDAYVRTCQDLVRSLYPDTFARINEMAVSAGDKLWVHLAHPSGLNGHFNTWLTGSTGPAVKRLVAQAALKTSMLQFNFGPAETNTDDLLRDIHTAKCSSTREVHMATENSSDRFSHTFYLEHQSGDRLYPARMKNRDTGRVAFRVSKGGTGGNTKEAGIEIEDENEMMKYVLERGFAVRAATLDRSRNGLYMIGQKGIRRAVKISS